MPHKLLTEEERTQALQEWWATFPYGSVGERLEAIHKFEQQYGPLTEAEKRKARFRWSPETRATAGVTKEFLAPTDIGEEAALKLCGQLLDNRHYDLLLDEALRTRQNSSKK